MWREPLAVVSRLVIHVSYPLCRFHQDRILFASNWASYFQPSDDVLQRVIAEMRELPLKETVKEKWLYHNAARLFQRE